MNLILKRFEYGTNYTIGKLYNGDEYVCYTLEDKFRQVEKDPVSSWKVPGATAIPTGVYKVVVDFSNHFQKDLPHVLDVEGFEGIRIHSGNSDKDTEGCILLGMNWAGNDWISNSTIALGKFMTMLQDQTDVTIKVE